jgi:ribokinase
MSGSAVVIGSLHMDLIARADRLPRRGESVTGGVFTMTPGGKAGNQAIQLALCGVETTLISRVGDDQFGRELRDAMGRKGVGVNRIAIDPVTPTGASVVLAAEGDYASVIAPGAASSLSLTDLESARVELERADLVLLQWELDPIFTNEALGFCAERGKTILFNASPIPTNQDALSSLRRDVISWLIVNQAEAGALAGLEVSRVPDADRAAGIIQQIFGVANIVVTMGSAGSIWCGASETIAQSAFPATVVDTVGAGDAFLGSLAAALIDGLASSDALRRASAAGAIAVSRSGAYDALPTVEDIDRFLAEFDRPSDEQRARRTKPLR